MNTYEVPYRVRIACGRSTPTESQIKKAVSVVARLTELGVTDNVIEQVLERICQRIIQRHAQREAEQAAARLKPPKRQGPGPYSGNVERNTAIFKDWLAGVSKAELGRRHGITDCRVGQIIAKALRRKRATAGVPSNQPP